MTAPTKAREGGGRTRYVPTHALSIRQPWAWLIVHGYKDVENRTWRTDRRGPIWIHTGKTFDLEGYQWVRMNMPDVPLPHRAAFELGGVVGRAKITDVVDESDSPWFFGPHGLVLADPHPVTFLAHPGRLFFFQLRDSAQDTLTVEVNRG